MCECQKKKEETKPKKAGEQSCSCENCHCQAEKKEGDIQSDGYFEYPCPT